MDTELTMTIYEHIEELRAELAASIDAGERQQIAAELERAVTQHQQEEAAFDALISVEPPH
ncbi:invasion plasmid antigen / internalin (plasmid) [Sinorhizobium americanum]|uniref:Invasion plasmid antigen / internalin n=3 Tax=Sinorhizobium americanum TaxID=194963 RepID=A0A1L3LSQ5_9HYPH|nr:invasion plasmid antigen / internalin [Sinorhizobium americanum]